MNEQQANSGTIARVLRLLTVSESVLSSLTIALTGLALGTCALYALALILGGTESWLFLLIAILLIPFMTRIMVKAASEDGLKELKSNRAFAFGILFATILRDFLSLIVLFRLVLYAAVLFGDTGVDEGMEPLWNILRRVILG